MTIYLYTPEEHAERLLYELNAKGLHDSGCNTRKRYRPPTNPRTGETYDVYIFPQCDCWLSEPFPQDFPTQRKILLTYENERDVHHHRCDVYFPIREHYRGREVRVRRNCNCFLAVDKPDQGC
jgi:hypothetical protein